MCKSPAEAFKGHGSYAEANIGVWNDGGGARRYLFHPSSPDEELCSCQNTSQGFGEWVPAGDRVRYARPNQKLIILSLTIDVARAKNPISISQLLHFISDRLSQLPQVAESKLV